MFELIEPLSLLAQDVGDEGMIEYFVQPFLLALLFSALGIVLLAVGFFVLAKILPFSLRKEIEEDQNTALAILISSFVLGISMIIAAAIVG